MAKFIYVDGDSRVQYVENTRPNNALADQFIEVADDSVAEKWWYDSTSGTVYQYKPLTLDEVRAMRDQALIKTDWMVLEDSPYQGAGQETNLAAIKTYRQQLRDYPDASVSYNENNINLPSLTLS